MKSLLDTDYPDLEILIVEDGSQDDTWEVAQKLMSIVDCDIRAFRHPDSENHGVSASRNLGIRESTGELVCFLDADDYMLPNRFDVAVDILRSQPNVDAVYERARMEFEGPRDTERFWDESDMFGISAPVKGDSILITLLRGACWPTSGILLRREVFERCGIFPEDFRYAEDYHLWLRMACVTTIVPGNLAEPVSVYFRHEYNTFNGGLERKKDIINAMTEVYLWLGKQDRPGIGSDEFANLVTKYIRNTLIRTREMSRISLGRKVIATVARERFWAAFFDLETLRQMVWVLLGRSAASVDEVPFST